MNFTSSLEIGNSVLVNIENVEKNYANEQKTGAKCSTKASCEIIDDSPTNVSSRGGKKNKENSRDALTQSRYRRRALRKNKSDSILQGGFHSNVEHALQLPQEENLTDYFKSPMEFGGFTAEKASKGFENINRCNKDSSIENKRQRLSTENDNDIMSNNVEDMFAESMELSENIRFSVNDEVEGKVENIMNFEDSLNGFKELNVTEDELMEKVICSEDLKELGLSFSSNSEMLNEVPTDIRDQCNISHVNDRSFQFSNRDIENFAIDMSSDINFHTMSADGRINTRIAPQLTKLKLPKINVEEIVNTEDTSFMGSKTDSPKIEGHRFKESSIDLPKTEILLSQPRNLNFGEPEEHINLSKCSGKVLNWSVSSSSETPSKNNVSTITETAERQLQPDSRGLKCISNWGLPARITNEYHCKGIREMFDWQVECLSNPKILFDHANLVYSAPTSAGKTLVSEILTIKTVIERQKKALVILPFISVVREKMTYLQDLLTSSGYRVDGFYGGYSPPGGFENINVAICTIEKANSIINKLLEQDKLNEIGIIVVDEIHLISDPGRGYILELLLSKVAYMCRKYGIQIQIVAMSATLPNIVLLHKWLQAEYYITNYRPVELQEMIKIGTKIYNNQMELLRELKCEDFIALGKDQDHIAQLCIETILIECSAIVFCPSKDWCETLCLHLAESIMNITKLKGAFCEKVSTQIKKKHLDEVKMQLKNCPAGLDSVLAKTVSFACAFHHAGLTSEERDIIEMNFKTGALKILVATSTLSSGVNLPARRVIIRSPLFAGKKMNSLTYKQMIGRAGRTGKDTLGESILICTETNLKAGKELVCSQLLPIKSCLRLESSMPLKRALLEVISSGVASLKEDVKKFLECTLLHVQNLSCSKIETSNQHLDSGNHSSNAETTEEEEEPLNDSLNFLIEYEFIRLQMNEQTNEMNYVPTRLGMACLSASLPPNDGLLLFSELQKSRRCFVLETELHAVYLVTPYSVCYQINDIDWLLYLDLHERLSPSMKRVAELVGVKESFLVKAMRGNAKLDYKTLQIHKRFYIAMALQELVNEAPLKKVSAKYKCSRGLLQSLQQMSSTFAGIVTSFCNALNWTMLALIVSEFKERLFFGVHRDLIDLMRIPDLNGQKARALFNAGIKSLVDLANADCFMVEKVLFNSVSFDTEKKRDDEDEYDANKRNLIRGLYITGKAGLTIKDVAKLLISHAQRYLQHEIGVKNVMWNNQSSNDQNAVCVDESIVEVIADSISKTSTKNTDQAILRVETQSETNQNALQASNHTSLKENQLNCIPKNMSSQTIPRKFVLSEKGPNFALRRSPRNHTSIESKNVALESDLHTSVKSADTVSNQALEIKTSARVSDIFNESALDVDTQIAAALDKQHTSNTNNVQTAEKPIENIIKVVNSPIDKSIEEIIESQTPKVTQRSLRSSNATRTSRARLTQRKLRSKRNKLEKEFENETLKETKKKTNASSSIEISDCASSSLLKNPMQLNSSYDLSTSKAQASSTSYKCISIVDMCGDQALFQACMEEIKNAKSVGFSVAVQKLPHERRPIIGANLLINQVQNREEETDNNLIFDDIFYVVGISLCIQENTVLFFDFQKKDNENKLSLNEKKEHLLKILENDKLILRIFDAKEQLKVLRKCLPELKVIKAKIEDPKVAHWLLEPDTEMSLKNIVKQYSPECCAISSLAGTCISSCSAGLNSRSSILGKIRASVEACISLHVLESQLENLERIANANLKTFFHELEMPVQCALWKMEMIGFPVDECSLGNLSKYILDIMKKLEQKMYELHGSRFNVASTSTVARVLGLHRKPNGKFSTAKQILEKIDSPMSNIILNYRKLGATLNKAIQPLIQCAKNGRIHGNSITFTSTGRISMHEPNLQNIAKDFTVEIEGDSHFISCRSSFSCVAGKSLISVDFCQLEMRILTHLSRDEILVKIMQSEEDIFQAIAARWNKISQDDVSESVRNGTKQICYGIIYGMGLKSLAENLKCDIDDAAMLVEQFHSAYPGIRSYTNKVIKFAKQNGYVETITGRKRYLPHITSSDETLKGQAERQAINTTIQGSAADIAKKAIVRSERNILKYSSRIGINFEDVKFVLHLHDELLFEVPDNKITKIAKILRASMENSAELNVPLRVKIRAGKSWGALQEIY